MNNRPCIITEYFQQFSWLHSVKTSQSNKFSPNIPFIATYAIDIFSYWTSLCNFFLKCYPYFAVLVTR